MFHYARVIFDCKLLQWNKNNKEFYNELPDIVLYIIYHEIPLQIRSVTLVHWKNRLYIETLINCELKETL